MDLELGHQARNVVVHGYNTPIRSRRQCATAKRFRVNLHRFRKKHDHYPKFLLTLDEDPSDDFDGIRKLNVLDWLLQ